MYKPISINYKSLEPYLGFLTIDIHYNKHYMGYLNKLNDILNYLGYDFRYSKVELFDHIDEFNILYRDNILFNLGGVLNHENYFSILKTGSKPQGVFYDALVKSYGSYDKFKNEFKNKASSLVGSGYTNLVVDSNGNFNIINTSNQDTVYSIGFTPIISFDLWEHAYYLDYKNNRGKYIDDFFSMIDFDFLNEKYKKIQDKVL